MPSGNEGTDEGGSPDGDGRGGFGFLYSLQPSVPFGWRSTRRPLSDVVGGHRLRERTDLYRVESVLEKPTPTLAEQRLMVPGLRAGHYLCFFGTHVLTPAIFAILEELIGSGEGPKKVALADALSVLAKRERYLAMEMPDRRYDIGVRYGLMTAQLALALNGKDRDLVLTRLLELLASREQSQSNG